MGKCLSVNGCVIHWYAIARHLPFHRHEKVLEAVTICHENILLHQQNFHTKEQREHAVLPVGPTRFDPIIDGLKSSDDSLTIACLQLVNVLVCQPEDLDFRMHLRNEFMRAGLIHIFEVSFVLILIQVDMKFSQGHLKEQILFNILHKNT